VCVSERTLLPGVVTARAADELGECSAESLPQVLLRLSAAPHQVQAEWAKMSEVAFWPNRNRRLLGTANLMFELS
jgi:hypothetical protein